MKLVKANESTASRRRVFFHLVDATDGITPETGEAAGQPQVSVDGAAWTNTGISTLTAIGEGRYYAELTQTLIENAGVTVETRYKSANTAECPGDTVHVVAFDPHNADTLGLSRLNLITSANIQITGIPAGLNNVITLFKGDLLELKIPYDATANNLPEQLNSADNGSLKNYVVSLSIEKLENNADTFSGVVEEEQYVCEIEGVGTSGQKAVVWVDTSLWARSINQWAPIETWVKGQDAYAYSWVLSVSDGHAGTAQAGTSDSITLADDAAVDDDFYNGQTIIITSGTGANATPVTITDYNGTTKVATVAAWVGGTPDATSGYQIAATRCRGIKAGFMHVRGTSRQCAVTGPS